jgi:hypothetical protein
LQQRAGARFGKVYAADVAVYVDAQGLDADLKDAIGIAEVVGGNPVERSAEARQCSKHAFGILAVDPEVAMLRVPRAAVMS